MVSILEPDLDALAFLHVQNSEKFEPTLRKIPIKLAAFANVLEHQQQVYISISIILSRCVVARCYLVVMLL